MDINTQDAILISILVFVILIFILCVELYRNLLSVLAYYAPDPIPPSELRFSSNSFIGKKSNGKKK